MSTIYTFNNKVLKNSANDKWLIKKEGDPYNPLGLPPYTIRIQVKPGTQLVQANRKGTITAVSGETDVYDVCTASLNNPGDWGNLLFGGETYNEWGDPEAIDSNVIAILGANSTGVTSMTNMCCYCMSLTDVALFDTSTVEFAQGMFAMAFDDYNTFDSELTHIPNFNFASLRVSSQMFFWCTKVESGALTLYNQLNALGGQIYDHNDTFHNCGKDTQSGAAELAQIPSDWK
jgi:hypothetical protein